MKFYELLTFTSYKSLASTTAEHDFTRTDEFLVGKGDGSVVLV